MISRPAIRVLLIEDSPTDAELIRIGLEDVRSADFLVESAESLEEGFARLRATAFDVVLVDLSLPDCAGIETCVRVHDRYPDVPVIVLTGLDDEETALEAMKVGAQDYLVKGQIGDGLLSRSIRYSIERQRAVEEQRKSDERMRLLTEQLPAVLWTTDRDLRLTEPSTHFLARDSRPCAGMRLHDYFETDDDNFAPIKAHRKALDGESISLEFRWKGHSYSVHVEPLRDAALKIIGTIGISLDVSTQKRLQSEVNAARHVQQSLFPHEAPSVPGFDIAGAEFPAEETAGDYYDFIPMPNDCLGLVVGDVTGHGLGPALLMAELRAYLRALASSRPHSGEILMLANRFLTGDLEDHRFVTLCFVRLDVVRRSFTYASAGHCAYLIKASGEVEHLAGTGLPLGLISDTIINTSFPVDLEPGDILFIPTDGFQEAHTKSNELFGLDTILNLVKENRGKTSEEIIVIIHESVCRHVGSDSTPDDMSAIIVRCLDPTGKQPVEKG